MLQDIKQHIDLVDGSIAWAKEFGKESFPYDVFKEYRRKLKRIYAALEENCSAAAYGESQVGKSYLMSSLLSSPNSPFVITNAGKSYSFIDDINPSGGNNAKIESTGVITRFTLSQGCSTMSDFVKVRNLSVVDIILLLADSYYNDIKINQDSVLRYDDINKALEDMNGLWASKIVVQNEIEEDDVKDITDYIHDVIGNAAAGVNQSNFCKIVAPVIQYVSYYEKAILQAKDNYEELVSIYDFKAGCNCALENYRAAGDDLAAFFSYKAIQLGVDVEFLMNDLNYKLKKKEKSVKDDQCERLYIDFLKCVQMNGDISHEQFLNMLVDLCANGQKYALQYCEDRGIDWRGLYYTK